MLLLKCEHDLIKYEFKVCDLQGCELMSIKSIDFIDKIVNVCEKHLSDVEREFYLA